MNNQTTILGIIIAIFAIGFAIEVSGMTLLFIFNFVYDLWWRKKKMKMYSDEIRQDILSKLAKGQEISIKNGQVKSPIDMNLYFTLGKEIDAMFKRAKKEKWNSEQLQNKIDELCEKHQISTKDNEEGETKEKDKKNKQSK